MEIKSSRRLLDGVLGLISTRTRTLERVAPIRDAAREERRPLVERRLLRIARDDGQFVVERVAL